VSNTAHRSRRERSAPGPRGPNPQSMRMWRSIEIMDDAREVAARRKRQLGVEPSTTDEPQP
jgi:hypothetical protein